NEADYQKKERTFLKEHYQIKPNEKVIIHISNFRKVKRIGDVIDTFANINQSIPSKLIFAGDGPELQTAMEQVKKLQLEEQVIFLGKQKNISELVSLADLRFMMPVTDSCGLVLLEAMACEVATIGTDVRGIAEVIKDGKSGYIVDVGATERASELALRRLNHEE